MKNLKSENLKKELIEFFELLIGYDINQGCTFFEVQLRELYHTKTLTELKKFFLLHKARIQNLLELNKKESTLLLSLLSENYSSVFIVSLDKTFYTLYEKVARKSFDRKQREIKHHRF